MAKRIRRVSAQEPAESGLTDQTDQPSGTLETRIVEEYLTQLREIHASGAGVAETSYYPALSRLFDAVGRTLKPKVRCLMNLRNLGAGLPDGGLFTADQFQRQSDGEPKAGQLPARGAIEAKGTKPEVQAIAESQQVKDYLKRYGIVLVTNLRDFLIVERGGNGRPVERETFALADDERDFWRDKAAHPRRTAQQKGRQFIEFLKRACLHAAPLGNPKDVAWFLASYARDALFRVEQQKQLPALQTVRSALEQALGMKFTEDKGEHFFRSTLVQTLFYGVFSAWVRWHKDRPVPNANFDWRTAEWSLHVPFVRTLYEEVAKPSRLGPLGLVEVLDWSANVLNRVDRDEFFKGFEDEHAVQYFYEPFLEAYDPELRKELGVWYTPREIVKYQVARVDRVLREELDLPDGLADPNVIVLDPCCGTGAYLVEVLNSIAATLRDKGDDALVASDLKRAAMNRVFGFEIMPAPFVVAHLQLALLLQSHGAPLSQKGGDRVGVYLTNALTGWESPRQPKQHVMDFVRELEEEKHAAGRVKREAKILVVLGNPPYNAFAGVSPDEERGLVELYKEGLNVPTAAGGWGIRKFNVDDLYVRFFRLAERRIAEMTGKGVVSFISNFSYLADPSFVVMRQRFLSEFDRLWFDCMNGDSRETGKLTPDGKPDPSVFSTEYNREGIRVGTAVCVMVRKANREKTPRVRFRHFWGIAKRKELLASVTAKRFDAAYTRAKPANENRYSFRPEDVSPEYNAWPKVPELSVRHFNGPVERRAGALISIDRQPLERRIAAYFDAETTDEEVKAIYASLMMTGNRIVGPEARNRILREHRFDTSRIVKYPFKVFDVRWCYLDNLRPLFSEPSPELLSHRIGGNAFFITRDSADKVPEGPPFYFSPRVCDYDSISGHARHFPVLLAQADNDKAKVTNGQNSLLSASPMPNLSPRALAYLSALRVKDPDGHPELASLIWVHALAIGYSPAYLTENADGIRRDWPRIPLPRTRKALEESAALGRRIAALLDTEAAVPRVTAGQLDAVFRTIGALAKVEGGGLDPNSDDFAVTAGWGHAGKGGVTMPAKGRLVQRPYDKAEREAIGEAAQSRGLSVKQLLSLLGPATCDVYLNDKAYWKNVPSNVWEYYIGGYQVIKKWLSYRELELLGRTLKPDEAREVTNIARRIAAIILLQPSLDANYRRVSASPFDWA